MRDLAFEEKYNAFTTELIKKNIKGFAIIDEIHNYLFDYTERFCDLRDGNTGIKTIEKVINELYQESIKEEELSNLLLRCFALIRLYQPFYDGNTRTAFLFLKYIFNKNNIEFLPTLNENYDNIIYYIGPTLYDKNDVIHPIYKKRIKDYLK